MRQAFATLILVGLLGCGEHQAPQRARLLDADGRVLLNLVVVVASTEYERQEGLRLHGPLSQNEGLLLSFPGEAQVCITNTGVPFPIDVLYLSASRELVATEHNIPPNAPGPYCHPQTQLALELNGDTLPPLNYAKLQLF